MSGGRLISGRHQLVFTNPAFPEGERVPLGFCCGGFSSTAGYVPGNEAQPKLSDCATTKMIILRSATRFYPGAFGKSRETLASKPFGFSVGRQ
jgi:hypothetical protein